MEKGRNDVYCIAGDCQKYCTNIKTKIEEVSLQTAAIIKQVDANEEITHRARSRLVEVSRGFNRFSENDIKIAYHEAQQCQKLLDSLRQQEKQLRQRREELIRQLRNMEDIATRADEFVQNSNLALKILQGNKEEFKHALEDVQKMEQMELWIMESMEAERRKIARDLHDGPAQNMASMLIRLDLIRSLCNIEEEQQLIEKAEEEIRSIKNMGQDCLDDIRRIMFDLKPGALKDIGLIDNLTKYFRDYEAKYDFNIEFTYLVTEGKRFAVSLEVALFRLIQEAITNIRKHSGVRTARVHIEERDKNLLVLIEDRGKGFDIEKIMQEKSENYGIIGMQERAELLGGEIGINTVLNSGTRVIIRVPTEREKANNE